MAGSAPTREQPALLATLEHARRAQKERDVKMMLSCLSVILDSTVTYPGVASAQSRVLLVTSFIQEIYFISHKFDDFDEIDAC